MADDIKRRDFLKLVGLGGAATALTNCTQPVERIIPYLVREEGVTPGEGLYFATVCRECPAGCGIIMRTVDGRATKPEGNPHHPVNQGKLCMRGQASVQGLYNPDRFRQPQRSGTGEYADLSWADALGEISQKVKAAAERQDAVVYLGGLTTGTFDTLVDEFLRGANSASRYTYEAVSFEPLRRAAQRAFGVDAVPANDFSKAGFVVSFGADFLETWVSPVEYARQFGQMHSYRAGTMGRFAYVGPRLSMTAANGEEWVKTKAGQELAVALGVLHVLVNDDLAKVQVPGAQALTADFTPERAAALSGASADAIRGLARQLVADTSLAVAGVGSHSAEELALVVNLINYATGNVGRTVLVGPNQTQGKATADLTALIERMETGAVEVLFINEVNPAYSLPNAGRWNAAIARVPLVVYLSSTPSETAVQAHIVLATHSPYEQWNDYVPREGVFGLMQPVMRPLGDSMHPGDILLQLAGAGSTYEDYLRNAWRKRVGTDTAWREALMRGGVFEEVAPVNVSLAQGAATVRTETPSIEGSALVAYPTIQFYDGRLANRPWLQEHPDPITKLLWQSWVEVHPRTAAKYDVKNGDVVALETPAGSIEAAVYIYKGVAEDVFAVPIGQGHTEAFGRYAGDARSHRGAILGQKGARGANAWSVLPGLAHVAPVSVTKTGRREHLITVQGSDTQKHYGHDRGISKVVPLSQVALLAQRVQAQTEDLMERPKREWDVGTVPNRVAGIKGEQPGQSVYPPFEHPVHRWAMAIDLTSCIGCGSCAIACYAENNIPVVGPELIAKGREMAWMWIERFFEEGADDERPDTRFVPMLCQHCTNAPCEPVCPVYATYHNAEGLNVQVYNRCVGTRYCGNNCPYKVRRFNWFQYEWPEPLNLQLNPAVSVRSKGVMEKCTFCIQRTREGKDLARDEGRELLDGDVVTACQQACPTNAITFGDLNDQGSRVAKLTADPLGYRVLDELNTQSAITYLRQIVHDAES